MGGGGLRVASPPVPVIVCSSQGYSNGIVYSGSFLQFTSVLNYILASDPLTPVTTAVQCA